MTNFKNFKGNCEQILVISLLTFCPNLVSAQTQNATLGQPSQIRFAIPNVTNQDKCHIEVSLPNQQKIAIDVDGPQFNAEVNFTPDQIGSTTLKWEGKRKNRGLNSVSACPGSGVIQVAVNGNTDYIAQQWNQYFAKVPEPIGECVKVGMDISQLKYQILADPNALLTGPEDQKLKPIYEKCEAFAKQNQPRKGAPCTLASQNNLRTTCDGVYAERQPDGRLKTISRTEAIQLQFEGKPWTVGVVETLDARATRLKQEEEDKAKQAANIAAQKDAEEKERLFKLSPEYKKQQAALEIKRLADERDAAQKKAEQEKIRIAEERQAAIKTKKDLEQQDALTQISGKLWGGGRNSGGCATPNLLLYSYSPTDGRSIIQNGRLIKNGKELPNKKQKTRYLFENMTNVSFIYKEFVYAEGNLFLINLGLAPSTLVEELTLNVAVISKDRIKVDQTVVNIDSVRLFDKKGLAYEKSSSSDVFNQCN